VDEARHAPLGDAEDDGVEDGHGCRSAGLRRR
jgi:hypothetical protein